MNSKNIIVCLFMLACWGQAQALTSHEEKSHKETALEYRAPFDVVKVFLAAVDRGEVEVFGHILKRAMLIPLRVEYLYELDTLDVSVKIFATLSHPIAVPQLQGMNIFAVSAILDSQGDVTEVSAHVKAE